MQIQNSVSRDELKQVLEISKEQFGSESWNAAQFESSLSSPSSFFFVAKELDEIVGFLVVQDNFDDINLLLIATKESFKRKGIGKALICALEKLNKKIWLEVRESNTSAQKFYEFCKFTPKYVRKKYYSNGENAIIFEK